MSLSLRGLLIALPITAFVIGLMALFTYRSAISDFRSDAAAELMRSNRAVTGDLKDKLALVAETEAKAAAKMADRLGKPTSTRFSDIFVRADDGAFHTRPELWSGADFPGSLRVSGLGGYFAPPTPGSERRDRIVAAFDTIKTMSGGLPDEIESLYFFSPDNDLLIYAPKRDDQLIFYRTAPADFDFQEAEISIISSPFNNPEGEPRCTSLQPPLYDESGQNWTTGCMLPIRLNGQHLGTWGISIPLGDLTASLQKPVSGARTVIASADGKLIHTSDAGETSSDMIATNIDMKNSRDPMVRSLFGLLDSGSAEQIRYYDEVGGFVAAEKLDAPDWFVFTVLPDEALGERAWSIAQRVILVGTFGALLLALILAAIFHRTIARRITRLAYRTDRIAKVGEPFIETENGDEIHQLERAVDKLEDRLDQARARESRSFDVLVDAAKGYAMALYDTDGNLLRANKGALGLFGEEGVARLGRDPVAVPGDEQASRQTQQVRLTQRPLADGTEAWLEETTVVLSDEDGATFGTAYIAHDLTSLKNAQRETEKTLRHLEMAQSSGQAGHFALDPETMDLTISSWLIERLGLGGPTLALKDVPDLIEEDRREGTMADIAHAIQAKTDFSFETVVLGKDGQGFPALIRGTTVFAHAEDADERELVGYYGILRDVSDEKEAATSLLSALDEANAEARARSEILAVLSHEIRTPIAGILGLIDHIRRERSETERGRALALIENSSQALLKTLDATLNRTRNERERLADENEEFEPVQLLEHVAELFRPLARRKGLSIVVEPNVSFPVVGRPARIQQILANFVSNAVKFTSVGSVTLACSCAGENGGLWTFLVTDTGTGIPPERMKSIFEPFAGSAADTLGRASGSGLGLSITRQLAEELGGSVEAAHAEGGGTRMILRIPLEAAVSEDHTLGTQKQVSVSLAQASLEIRLQALVEAMGFRIAENDEDDIDIAITDRPEILRASKASQKILVTTGVTFLAEKGIVAIPAAEIFDRLPDQRKAFGHE